MQKKRRNLGDLPPHMQRMMLDVEADPLLAKFMRDFVALGTSPSGTDTCEVAVLILKLRDDIISRKREEKKS